MSEYPFPDLKTEGWEVKGFGGEYSPMALGPGNASIDMYGDTIDIHLACSIDQYVAVPFSVMERFVEMQREYLRRLREKGIDTRCRRINGDTP